jgi:hypothetical protein
MPTDCVYVFCGVIRKNSDYFLKKHLLIGLYNADRGSVLVGKNRNIQGGGGNLFQCHFVHHKFHTD